MAVTTTQLPVYMRIGDGQEIQVGTVDLEPGDSADEAAAAIGQLLHSVSSAVEQRMRNAG